MKKFTSFALSIILMGILIVPTSASTVPNKTDIESILKNLEEKYNFEVVQLSDEDLQSFGDKELIKLDNVSEVENFLSEFKSIKDTSGYKNIALNKNLEDNNNFSILSSPLHGNEVVSWWTPFTAYGMTGIMTMKNVVIDYNYEDAGCCGYYRFTNVNSVSSYMSGIQVAISWVQTGYSHSYSFQCTSNDVVNININGYYLLGFDFNGFTIGAKFNDSWSAMLALND